jgi:hypothetical protein
MLFLPDPEHIIVWIKTARKAKRNGKEEKR